MALTREKRMWSKKEKGTPARLDIAFGDLREDGFVFQFYDRRGNESWLSPAAILKRKESIKKYHWDHKGRITLYKSEWWKQQADRAKSRMRKRLYGITDEQFISMWEEQDGKCKICYTELEITRSGYAIDHCHTSKLVRGILCSPCNKGLGHFKDNIEVLNKAASYLNEAKLKERELTC